MKLAKAISLLGLLAMTGILIYGFTVGDFSGEGARLLAMPWGIVSMVDLYVGFTLFSCWIVYREKAVLPSIIWGVLMMVLGFFTGALYTFLALQSSGGDWRKFFMGKRA
jgi:vacuolar-type H+-ATPase subunit I/STV1